MAVPVSAAAAVVLFVDAGWFGLSLFLLAAGGAFYRGRASVPAALLVLGGISVVSGDHGASVAVLTAASLWGLWNSGSLFSRAAFAACALAAFPDGSVQNLLPLLPGAVLAVPMRRRWQRGASIAAGMAAAMLLGRMPEAAYPHVAGAVENAGEAATSWSHAVPLDRSSPALLLERGEDGTGILMIRCSAGGVRDGGPIGAVHSGEMELTIDEGTETLELSSPEYPVRIEVARGWRPFTHPVVHFLGAEVMDGDD